MGFFNKLKGALDKLEDVKEVIEKAADTIQKSVPAQTTQSQTYTPAPAATTPVSAKTYNTGDSYFASLITQANFPGYTITTNVHANTFDAGAHPSCYPISYLFSNGSQPVLAVLVMNKNQYRSMIARGTYKVLEDNGIPYIRFFKGMENESGYVINRIRDNLR